MRENLEKELGIGACDYETLARLNIPKVKIKKERRYVIREFRYEGEAER